MNSYAYPGNPTFPFVGIPRSTGRIWFVDGTLGNDTYSGTGPASAFKTIGRALQRVSSGRGDVIFVYPGTYPENLVITQDYLSIIGAMGAGYGRPDVQPAAGVALTVHAQGFTSFGVSYYSADGIAAIQQGNGFQYDFCRFFGTTVGMQFLPDKDDDSYTASEGYQNNCEYRDGVNGIMFKNPGPGVEGGVGPTNVQILNPTFAGNSAEDIIDADTAGSNDNCFEQCAVVGAKFLTTKAVYVTLTNGGNNTGTVSGSYNDDGIDGTKVAVAAGIGLPNSYDRAGVIDQTGF